MKSFEDRIKEKLEGYESSLPEHSLDDFMAKFDDVCKTPSVERRRPYVLWLASLAVAAAAIALIFIPRADEDIEQALPMDTSTLVAEVLEVQEKSEAAEQTDEKATDFIRHPDKVSTGAGGQSKMVETVPDSAPKSSESAETSEEPDSNIDTSESKDKAEMKDEGKETTVAADFSGSPFVPSSESARKKNVKISTGGLTAGIIGGAGAVTLAAVLPSVISSGGTTAFEYADKSSSESGDITSSQDDKRSGNDTHYMPLRVGASLRVPFSERWSFVTGIDYSWYSSSIGYTLSGDKRQNVHYLGIPMRADFTILHNKVVNLYVGAGAAADFCIAADLGGKKIDHDGVGFSLQGAGGIQFNLGKAVGLYIEPMVSWEIPSERRVIDTYRTEHQVMFSVATGIRFSIPYSY